MKHVFVIDSKAFNNQQWKLDNIVDSIGQFFRTQGKLTFSTQFSRYRRNAMGIIYDEVEKAEPGETIRIYAIGGEELHFDCLNGAAHFPRTQLAMLPYGKSNDFLKIFGEDKVESFKDIPTLVKANVLPTDLMRWGVNYALNSCYIGMNSTILKHSKDLKANLNKTAYFVVSKIFLFFNNFFAAFNKQIAARDYKVTVDELDYSGSYSLIHVANSPFLSGKKSASADATPDDGLFDIALIKASNPFKTLFSINRYLNGKPPKNCIFTQGKKIQIHSDSPMWIQLDNEYIQDNDINLSVIHHALQVAAAEGLSYPLGSISAI
jgi:diacylglycerol kinase family enzyme